MAAFTSRGMRWTVWIILGLVILGLGGYGVTNFGGSVRSIGSVGGVELEVDRYARALDQELRSIEVQTGQRLTTEQIRLFGIDRLVLARLIRQAALDAEAARIGLSVGDAEVLRRIGEIDAFRGLDGRFDPGLYRDALSRAGLRPADFEEDIRREAARSILLGAVTGGIVPPRMPTETIVAWAAERRDAVWVELTPDLLVLPPAEPDEETLRAFYERHKDQFMRSEVRRLTYVTALPEQIVDTISIPEEEIRAAYEADTARYHQPERRIVNRLAFPTEAAAKAARRAIEAGEKSWEQVVAERGLTPDDVVLGEVTRDDLGAAAEAVFSAPEGAVVGPVQTDLGPALFRVEAVLPAEEVPYEQAREEIRNELAIDRARALLAEKAQSLDERLAGGATLEELAGEDETLSLGQMAWTEESDQGPAAYEEFRTEAARMKPGDFPVIRELPDGGLFALRVDAIEPAHVPPFEEIRDEVLAAWKKAEIRRRLTELAERAVQVLDAGGDFAAAGLPAPEHVTEVRRTGVVEGLPALVVAEIFRTEPGKAGHAVVGDRVFVFGVEAVRPPDPTDPDVDALRRQVSARLAALASEDLASAYAQAILLDMPPQIDARAVDAVVASVR